MSKRGRSRGRSSLPYDITVDRNDPNWPYGPASVPGKGGGPSPRGAPAASVPNPTRTFVREASPEFVPGPEPEPDDDPRSISPNESMVSLSFHGTEDYEQEEAPPPPPPPRPPPPSSASNGGFQILRMPMRPRFVSPPGARPRPRPVQSPFGAAPFSPVAPRGTLRPIRRVGSSPITARGSRGGAGPTGPGGVRMFRGPPPPNFIPIRSPRMKPPPSSSISDTVHHFDVDSPKPASTRLPQRKSTGSEESTKSRGGAQRGKSTGKGRRGGVKASSSTSSSAPVEISLDSDEDDDLEIVGETRLTHKPVEKSPLEILVEQHNKTKDGAGAATPEPKDGDNKSGASKTVVRNGPKSDAKKRFPDWSSSDEASPAKTPRRSDAATTPSSRRPSKSDGGNAENSTAASASKTNSGSNKKPSSNIKKPEATTTGLAVPSGLKTSPPTPARRKLTEIQFQERRQLLLCSWPDATEKSLRRAIESTETTEEAEDWFFKFGERKTVDVTETPSRNMPRVYKNSGKEEKPEEVTAKKKDGEDDDDVVPLDSDGEDADGTDDEEKRERVLGKVKVPIELDSRMKANLFYFKQEMARESKSHDEITLKRALAKFNWKIEDAGRYLKFGHKKKRSKPASSPTSAKPLVNGKSSDQHSQSTPSTDPATTSTGNTSESSEKDNAEATPSPAAKPAVSSAQPSPIKSTSINGVIPHEPSPRGGKTGGGGGAATPMRGGGTPNRGGGGGNSHHRGGSVAVSSEDSSSQDSSASAAAEKKGFRRTVVEPISISDDDDEDSEDARMASPGSGGKSAYRGRGFGSGQMINRGRGRGGRGGVTSTPKTPLWKQVISSDDDSDSNSNFSNKKKKKSTTHKKKLSRYGREEDGEEEDWETDDDIDAVDSDDMEIGEGFGVSQYTSANEKEMILSFFNETSLEELQILPGCKKNKAATILQLRPFADWDDLIAKIEVSIGKNVITEGKSVIKTRSTVVRLMIQCQKISKSISREVKEMISAAEKAEERGEVESIMKQPPNLSAELKLKPFQLIGLNWLKLMHRHEKNGILADEMGLGKTIQAIAFLAYLLHTGNKGPHLIVVPSSIFDNWRKELELWCPALKVLPYTGNQDERAQIRDEIMDENALENYNILISTYSQMTSTTEDRILFKNQPFNYVIYDEAHQLKNMDTQKYQHLMRVKAQRRLLLTGTPLQNNLVELMSLLAFVMPSMFSGKTEHLIKIFKTVSVPDKTKQQQQAAKPEGDTSKSFEHERIQHAKNIMKPFVLRRLKKDVLHHLPAKIEHKELVVLLTEQKAVYDNLVKSFSKKVKAIGNVTDARKNNAFVKASSGMMMDLRKCANHPLLVRNYYDDDTLAHMAHLIKTQDPGHAKAREDLILDDLKICNDIEVHNTCQKFPDILEPFLLQNEQICQSGKMAAMDKLFGELKPKGDRVLLFSQFTMLMDIIEVYLEHRGHSYLRLDGSTPIAERQALIDEFNNDESIFLFLLSTKAGGHGINLTAANTVVIHDIDFNPYNDKQAADRCHRVGQSRPVTVYRLIGKETIEENMLRAAEKKLRLEAEVVGEESTYASLAGPAKTKKEKEEEEQMAASMLKEVLLQT